MEIKEVSDKNNPKQKIGTKRKRKRKKTTTTKKKQKK